MPDLHSRIASELSRRLEVAKAATPGPWRVCVEGSEGSRLAPDYGDLREKSRFIGIMNGRVQPEDGRNARFSALHDPADAQRRYSSALRVLERHAPEQVYRDHLWPAECRTCHAPGEGYDDYGGPLDWPCPEIADLCASLGLDTEGSTTDG